jgi:hypothetical protein
MSAEQAAAPHLCRDDFPLFRHQVAGHFPLLWREQTIYKPCKSIEVGFYQQMRDSFPALVPFTPKFYGVVSIDDPADVLARKRHEAESADSAVDSNSQVSLFLFLVFQKLFPLIIVTLIAVPLAASVREFLCSCFY